MSSTTKKNEKTTFPLYNYTHYSLQYGFSKPKELIKKCKENDYPACGIADYKTISGAVSFFNACKKADIKPIIGCSFDGFKLFAKNKSGWLDLIELLSTDNYHVIKKGNLVVVRKPDIKPLSDKDHVVDSFDEFFYTNQSDADIHRISLCSHLKTTIPDIQKDISKAGEYEKFFQSDDYYVKDSKNLKDNSICQILLDQCEEYNILEKPILPHFPTPNGESEEEYLKQLCRDGWSKKLIKGDKVSTEKSKQEYLERFQEEFEIFKNANLFGYFLIVGDILKFINENGWLSGPGRGCFLPDTRVKMGDGSMKPISQIEKGEMVIDAYGVSQKVTDLHKYDVDEEILEIEFENNKIIRCTKDHKFLTNNRGWIEAQHLNENDDVKEV